MEHDFIHVAGAVAYPVIQISMTLLTESGSISRNARTIVDLRVWIVSERESLKRSNRKMADNTIIKHSTQKFDCSMSCVTYRAILLTL